MLAAEPFSYRASGDDKVFLYWSGRQIAVLRAAAAKRFLHRIADADAHAAQLIMAKATGNFKRGNEKGR